MLHLSRSFVDDNRAWINTLKKGTRFEDGVFKFTWEAEDEDGDLTAEDVTIREFQRALNSVNDSLKFTLERPSDFEDGWIPTLDFKIWGDPKANRYTHPISRSP